MFPALLRRTSFLLISGRCILCSADSGRARDLCRKCESELPSAGTACRQCGVPMTRAAPEGRCHSCIDRPPSFQRLFTRFLYRSPIDRMMLRFKHQGQIAVGHVMAELTAAGFLNAGLDVPELLVPVPLTNRGQRRRGFNQALIIARVIGSHLGTPVGRNVLRRRLDSTSQKSSSRQARLAQVSGAFEARTPLEGMHIGLVDDVVTTGATVEQCSRVLGHAGAGRVTVIAVARTPPPGE